MPKDLTINVPVKLFPSADIEYVIEAFLGPEPAMGPTPIKGTIKAVERKKPGFADGGVFSGPCPPIIANPFSTRTDTAANVPATPYSNKSSASPTLPPESPAARKFTSAPPGDFSCTDDDLETVGRTCLVLWERYSEIVRHSGDSKDVAYIANLHWKLCDLRSRLERAKPPKFASPLHKAKHSIDEALHDTAAVEMIVSNQLDVSADSVNTLVRSARDCFKAASAALQTLMFGASDPAPAPTPPGSSPHSRDAA